MNSRREGTSTAAKPNGGVGAAAKQVAEHASALARLELELAAAELKRKVVALGLGIGLGIGALVFLFFAVGLLGMLALSSIRKGSPPVPQQAIQEAKLTTEALKNGGS